MKTEEHYLARIEELETELAKANITINELAKMVADAHSSKQFTEEWYAERWEEIRKWAEETENTKPLINIMANGTPSASSPPTYAQLLEREKWARARAERRVKELEVVVNGKF